MKNLFLGLLFFSFTAAGQSSQAEVRGFNFSFQDFRGEGVAEVISLNSQLSSGQQVIVDKIFDQFRITLEGPFQKEFLIDRAADLEKLVIKNLNFLFNQKSILTVSEASFKTPLEEVKMNQMVMECDRNLELKIKKEQFLYGCLKKMSLKMANWNSLFKKVEIKDFDFKLSDGKFEFVGLMKSLLGGKMKGKGLISYRPQEKVLIIQISEIKYGLINVTSQVFDELERFEDDKTIVEEPFVKLFI